MKQKSSSFDVITLIILTIALIIIIMPSSKNLREKLNSSDLIRSIRVSKEDVVEPDVTLQAVVWYGLTTYDWHVWLQEHVLKHK